MLAYTYLERGKFALLDKPKPVLLDLSLIHISIS